MSNYCKRISNRKMIVRGKIRTEKCDRKTPFTEISVGSIKQGRDIFSAISPTIDYLLSKGAENIYLSINNDARRVSVYTPDFGFNKEDLEKETKTPEVENVVRSLATLC